MDKIKYVPRPSFDTTSSELFNTADVLARRYSANIINALIILLALLDIGKSTLYDYLCYSHENTDIYNKLDGAIRNRLEDIMKSGKIPKAVANVSLLLDDDEEKIFKMDKDMMYIFTYASKYRFTRTVQEKSYDPDDTLIKSNVEVVTFIVTADDFLRALVCIAPKAIVDIWKMNGINYNGIPYYIDEMENPSEFDSNNQVQVKYDTPPINNIINKKDEDISNFITVLSDKYAEGKKCEILGRDEECRKVLLTLQKRDRKNIILVGPAGVGKTAIVEKIAYIIACSDDCPEALKDYKVVSLDVTSLISGTIYRGQAEARFRALTKYLEENEKVILFIDEVHMVIGAGGTASDEAGDLSNALKPYLTSPNSKVIGATTNEEYEKYFTDSAFRRRFDKVDVKEPMSKEVAPMLKTTIKMLEDYHGVSIDDDMIQYCILMASTFKCEVCNPDRTKEVIDSSMVIAKDHGKHTVDKESVLENFKMNYEMFNSMTSEDKLATAYHEAGHFLIWKVSKTLKDRSCIAISIMPAEGYLGITVYDRENVYTNKNKQYFIDLIALSLAGRIAERKYTNEITSGATGDLKDANQLVYRIVTQYGMDDDEKLGDLTFYSNDLMSDYVKNQLIKRRKALLKEGSEWAEKVLEEHKFFLDDLAQELLRTPIMDQKAIDDFCRKYNL